MRLEGLPSLMQSDTVKVTIDIRDFTARPRSISLPLGGTVKFVRYSSIHHTVIVGRPAAHWLQARVYWAPIRATHPTFVFPCCPVQLPARQGHSVTFTASQQQYLQGKHTCKICLRSACKQHTPSQKAVAQDYIQPCCACSVTGCVQRCGHWWWEDL